MRQINRRLAGGFEARENVQKKGIVSVFSRRNSEVKAVEFIVGRIETVAPRLE